MEGTELLNKRLREALLDFAETQEPKDRLNAFTAVMLNHLNFSDREIDHYVPTITTMIVATLAAVDQYPAWAEKVIGDIKAMYSNAPAYGDITYEGLAKATVGMYPARWEKSNG